MNIRICFILFLLFAALSNSIAQVSVVNRKGTVVPLDTSKWVISGSNIYNKNTGNVGVGNLIPIYKLDVTGKFRVTDSLIANSAKINALNSGTVNDSLVVIDPSTGILKRISANRIATPSSADSTTASNGLTLTGKDVRLGGSLTAPTSISTTASNTLSFSGLQSGAITDSILVADPSTGRLRRISANRIATPSSADSTTASNGLTLTGKDVRLGGSLTAPTSISTTASNTLSFSGLQSGAITDSILVADPSTGRLRRISANRLSSSGGIDSTTASNGLTLTSKEVKLGGSLTAATDITTSATNTLSISGLQGGSLSDSIVVSDPSTGRLKRIASGRIGGWGLEGNSGTSPSTNFIGTKDNVDLVFKINNTESGRLNLYNLSTTFGYNSVAAYKSSAFGYGATTTTNTESVAIGYNANTTAYQSVSVGADATASGNSAIAIGRNSTAGFQASAIGSNASATGNNSTAVGFGATTSQANALVLGNSSVKVGIGTSTPSNTLEVNSSSNPLKLNGLQSGSLNDSLLTANSSGVVRQISRDALPPILMLVASRTSSYSPSSSFSTLNYNSASTNVGSAYNTSTGEFTAPATGLYQVMVHNMYSAGVSNDNAVSVRIIANGSVDVEVATAQSPYSSGDTYSSAVANTVVSLNAGQKISIQVGDEVRTMTPQVGTGQHTLKIIRIK